jgi:hypothetical protein
MIGRSFKSVVWVAAIGAAALICYMFSLRVAEERAGLAELEGQIRRAEQSIQTLKTELGTRSRVHQLQHWAATDFGFASPTANQFLEGEVTLASLDMPAAAPAMEAPVQMASAAPAATPAKPVQAVAPAPAPAAERPAVRRASTQPAADRTALLRRASVENAPAAPTARPKPGKPAALRTPAARTPAASAQTAPAQTARPGLVNQRTLQAIERSAQAERGSDRSAGRPR